MSAEALDAAYDAYWNSTNSRPDSSTLLKFVRAEAIQMTHNADVAQEVCLQVHQQLERFSRADATAFSRWIRAMIRRTKVRLYPGSSDHTREYDDNSNSAQDETFYIDTSKLPPGIRKIAHKMLEGYSLTQIADQMNITSAALRNKLARYRKSPLRNAS